MTWSTIHKRPDSRFIPASRFVPAAGLRGLKTVTVRGADLGGALVRVHWPHRVKGAPLVDTKVQVPARRYPTDAFGVAAVFLNNTVYDPTPPSRLSFDAGSSFL